MLYDVQGDVMILDKGDIEAIVSPKLYVRTFGSVSLRIPHSITRDNCIHTCEKLYALIVQTS
jgi:hypothetical protein